MHAGKYIRKKRNEANLSLRQLASALGVTDTFVSKVERGGKRLTSSHWPRLAEVLAIDLDELQRLDELSEPIELELAEGADTGTAYQLARALKTTTLTDEISQSLIDVIRSKGASQ